MDAVIVIFVTNRQLKCVAFEASLSKVHAVIYINIQQLLNARAHSYNIQNVSVSGKKS